MLYSVCGQARELKELEEQTQEQVDEMQAILETQQRTAADERTLDRTKYSENKQKLQEKLKEQQKRIAAGTRYVRELEQSLTDKVRASDGSAKQLVGLCVTCDVCNLPASA